MKKNFNRIITAMAAAVMCAVPMTGAMSASAAPPIDKPGDGIVWEWKYKKLHAELQKRQQEFGRDTLKDSQLDPHIVLGSELQGGRFTAERATLADMLKDVTVFDIDPASFVKDQGSLTQYINEEADTVIIGTACRS